MNTSACAQFKQKVDETKRSFLEVLAPVVSEGAKRLAYGWSVVFVAATTVCVHVIYKTVKINYMHLILTLSFNLFAVS